MKRSTKKLLSGITLITLGLGGSFTLSATAYASDNSKVQEVTGTVSTGGLSGGVGANPGNTGLTTGSVDLGDMTIGKPIPPKEIKDLIRVYDFTGGSGWKLTAKSANSTTMPIKLQIKAAGQTQQTITPQESLIATGQSKLTETKLDGFYYADWTDVPKTGAFTYQVELTLTPQLK